MMDLQESRRRKIALGVFGGLLLIFILLSSASFSSSRERPDPETIRFQGQTAIDGKRIFQAYNCMGCHTIVGNGAYFAPDLTAVYASNGPAWLMAYLSKLETWPTKQDVDPWIDRLRQEGELNVTSTDAYYEKYDGARSDIEQRGGWGLLMPNLSFKPEEMEALVAFLNYSSQINTEGWPPEVNANPIIVERTQKELRQGFPGPRPSTTPTSTGAP
jgi:nitric oxide reductase large subunit